MAEYGNNISATVNVIPLNKIEIKIIDVYVFFIDIPRDLSANISLELERSLITIDAPLRDAKGKVYNRN
jgi:hypothetical protein